MEIFSPEFFSALLAIILIDLVLAGDNAIVIGLAARGLPAHLQKKAVFWGAVGAVVVRAVLTMAVVWLLRIPGFLLVGGLALIWIAWKLAVPSGGSAEGASHPAATTLRGALTTIVIADAVMGVDNVLAVAGAAHGSFLLVVIGLLVSIPIVMLGSTMILHWVERFPSIILLGAGVLGWTAAKMISAEQAFGSFFPEHHGWRLALTAFCVGIVLLPPLLARVRTRINAEAVCLGFLMVWLAVFNWIEEYVDARYYPEGVISIPHELIDLVMWLGWIPFVLMLYTPLVGRHPPVSREVL
ncbi:MAG TPA: TerC family protein [Rhodocyclaceae bacterium]|nr:TerC family protein [Rhodocyclaceae bacterium]HMV52926.1 TerC family protein [Rhodocyclaceae bacterium]HMZ83280.1 TerC family protein [Rhodocyclaceae bacterium]HNA03217.1 TerC family protein [Rhodocyclaceae bacterium]HNB78499.1 TerC family protein [Rhodocyclaceae bacterium]